jgi:hypothetical protein
LFVASADSGRATDDISLSARTKKPEPSQVHSAARAAVPHRTIGLFSLARYHDLGRLDDRQRIVAPAEFQLNERVAGDNGRQRLISNPQADLAEQAVGSHFLDVAAEAIATAQRYDELRRSLARTRPRPAGRRVPGEQTIYFRLGQPVMTTRSLRRSDLPLMNPLLQGRVSDAHPFRGCSHG